MLATIAVKITNDQMFYRGCHCCPALKTLTLIYLKKKAFGIFYRRLG